MVGYDNSSDYPSGFTFIQTKEQLHSIISCDSDRLINANKSLCKNQINKDSSKLAKEAYESSLKRLKLLSMKNLNFTKYNYIIAYGIRIDYIYYSLYNTFFKDDSPWNKEAYREYKNLLCIKYKNGMTSFDRFPIKDDGVMYLYRMDSHIKLREIQGP